RRCRRRAKETSAVSSKSGERTCEPADAKTDRFEPRVTFHGRTALFLVLGVLASCASKPRVRDASALAVTRQLTVSPSEPIVFEGEPGGPFQPAERTYIVRNAGGADIAWKV